jgi:hypothetical protein
VTKKVSWVLDMDIRGFFDALDHGWLVKFVEHRVADKRVVRLIQKWLNAGVLEDGTRTWSETGAPQGGSASPLLANVYLHYAFDLNEVNVNLKRRMHDPVPVVGQWLRAVLTGHFNYYGVPRNIYALSLFRFRVCRLWHRVLCRRSQKGRLTWERTRRYIDRWLPLSTTRHPHPLVRLGVIT